MVVWLYGCTFERDPYECGILVELRFRKVCILTSIYHATYATTPISKNVVLNSTSAIVGF